MSCAHFFFRTRKKTRKKQQILILMLCVLMKCMFFSLIFVLILGNANNWPLSVLCVRYAWRISLFCCFVVTTIFICDLVISIFVIAANVIGYELWRCWCRIANPRRRNGCLQMLRWCKKHIFHIIFNQPDVDWRWSKNKRRRNTTKQQMTQTYAQMHTMDEHGHDRWEVYYDDDYNRNSEGNTGNRNGNEEREKMMSSLSYCRTHASLETCGNVCSPAPPTNTIK